MKVLVVLLAAFVLAAITLKIVTGNFNWILSGNIAMCVMLCFTAIGHFVFVKGMAMMMPPFIPFKKQFVLFTGLLEIAAGVALLFHQYRAFAASILIVFFVLILPANIYAAVKKVDFQKASFEGPGPGYLKFRIPIQILFIAWVWYFGFYRS